MLLKINNGLVKQMQNFKNNYSLVLNYDIEMTRWQIGQIAKVTWIGSNNSKYQKLKINLITDLYLLS